MWEIGSRDTPHHWECSICGIFSHGFSHDFTKTKSFSWGKAWENIGIWLENNMGTSTINLEVCGKKIGKHGRILETSTINGGFNGKNIELWLGDFFQQAMFDDRCESIILQWVFNLFEASETSGALYVGFVLPLSR